MKRPVYNRDDVSKERKKKFCCRIFTFCYCCCKIRTSWNFFVRRVSSIKRLGSHSLPKVLVTRSPYFRISSTNPFLFTFRECVTVPSNSKFSGSHRSPVHPILEKRVHWSFFMPVEEETEVQPGSLFDTRKFSWRSGWSSTSSNHRNFFPYYQYLPIHCLMRFCITEFCW